MGIICPCGVKVNAISTCNNVKFFNVSGTIQGDLTYTADVCATMLGTSELTLTFTDTRRHSAGHSFEFLANEITSVECNKIGQNCEVTVTGTGIVNGVEHRFVAVFRDQVASAAVDIVKSFIITNFFDQFGAAPVPQGSIIALGCE